MTIPASGVITADQINAEIGRAASSPVSLNDPAVRLLARNTAKLPAASAISMNDLRGATGTLVRAYMVDFFGDGSDVGAHGFGGTLSDGVNSNPLGTLNGYPLRQIETTDPDGGGVRTYVEIDDSAPVYNSYFWGIAVYTDAWSYIGTLRFDQAGWQTSAFNGVRHVNEAYIGWYASGAGFLDLRPYKGQWLRFLFVK